MRYISLFKYVKVFKYISQNYIYIVTIQMPINSLSASLLLNIFLSFEVGIAHAIANFK